MNHDEPARGSGTPGGSSRPKATRRPPPRRRPLPWIRILIALVLAGGVAAYFGARPAWRYVKLLRAERFIDQAESRFREEQWRPGFERIRAALQLAPTNPRVLRAAGYAYSRAGSEAGFVYLDALLAGPQATVQDREEALSLALRVGNLELARIQVEELLEAANPSARALVLASQFHGARRDYPTALRLARESVLLEPTNPTNQFAVATLLLFSRNPKEIEEARTIVWPHARTNGPLQISALGAILGSPDVPRAEREEVERILSSRDPAQRTIAEDILLADARVALDPAQRSIIAEALIELHGRAGDERMAHVARWLNRHEMYAWTRDLILPDIARKNFALLRLRLEALVGLNDVRGAYAFLMEDKLPGDPLQVEFLRCATAIRLKDQAAIDAHYRNLVKLARQQLRSLRAVADFAHRNGNRAVANEVYQILLRNPRDAVPALRGLVRNSDAQGETWAARDYARRLNAAMPREDDSLKLQIAYYDLLLKENIDEAASVAEALHRAKPEDFNRRAILAFARLRQDKPAQAMDLLAGQMVTWNRVIPGVRAIVAATLGASGRTAGASNITTRVQLQRLKPEERELIKPYLTGIPLPSAAATEPGAPEAIEAPDARDSVPEKL